LDIITLATSSNLQKTFKQRKTKQPSSLETTLTSPREETTNPQTHLKTTKQKPQNKIIKLRAQDLNHKISLVRLITAKKDVFMRII